MQRLLPLMLVFAMGAAGARPAPAVTGAWIRLLPGDLPAAGYFTLRNPGNRPIRLTGATAAAFGRVMLHHSVVRNGQDHMDAVKSVEVPAHGEVRFAPGGYHLMLMRAKHPLSPGGKLPITLKFGNDTQVTVVFMLKPATAEGP